MDNLWLIDGHFLLKKHQSCFHALAQPREGFIYGYFLPHRVAHINLWEFVAH